MHLTNNYTHQRSKHKYRLQHICERCIERSASAHSRCAFPVDTARGTQCSLPEKKEAALMGWIWALSRAKHERAQKLWRNAAGAVLLAEVQGVVLKQHTEMNFKKTFQDGHNNTICLCVKGIRNILAAFTHPHVFPNLSAKHKKENILPCSFATMVAGAFKLQKERKNIIKTSWKQFIQLFWSHTITLWLRNRPNI